MLPDRYSNFSQDLEVFSISMPAVAFSELGDLNFHRLTMMPRGQISLSRIFFTTSFSTHNRNALLPISSGPNFLHDLGLHSKQEITGISIDFKLSKISDGKLPSAALST